MKKFWDWMKERDYGGIYNFEPYLNIGVDNMAGCTTGEVPKQMLIGYMIEYLKDQEKHISGKAGFPEINSYYELLKQYIEDEIFTTNLKRETK